MSNWRTDLAYPASYPRVGSIELLRRARREVKSMRPDALFYIEAGSPHFRQSSEVNYPNDETWLPAALFGDATTAYGQPFVSSPLTARGIEAWLKRCEQIVPPGSQGRTVHHLSSHDTVWWSPPGRKWCIERYGRDGTIAMTAILTLIDGSYMTFAGDEREIEPAIKQLLTLRKELPELRKGDCSFDVITSSDEKVFTALRSHEGDQSIIAVNLADEPTEATVSLPASVVQGEENVHMYDALRREWYRQENSNVNEGSIDSITLSFEPFEPRLIVLRETTE